MKYFLTPITMLLWYFTAYFGLYFAFFGIMFLFSLSWIWLLLAYIFLYAILVGLTTELPNLLRIYILKLYDFNRISCVVHGIAGVFGVYQYIIFFISDPPAVGSGDNWTFFLTAWWDVSPIKTIFLTLPLLGIVFSLIWSTAIAPFVIASNKESNWK